MNEEYTVFYNRSHGILHADILEQRAGTDTIVAAGFDSRNNRVYWKFTTPQIQEIGDMYVIEGNVNVSSAKG